MHQISTYKELDKEFFKEKAFQFLEGNIDVSLLHCGLSTQQQIEEEDVIWEWNKLFTEVVSVLTVNREQQELAYSIASNKKSNDETDSIFANKENELSKIKSDLSGGGSSTSRRERQSYKKQSDDLPF